MRGSCAFTKSTNMNLIVNLNKWFGLNYEIIYFFNVFGPRQIKQSSMSAVVGIFEEQYLNNKDLTIEKTFIIAVVSSRNDLQLAKTTKIYESFQQKNIQMMDFDDISNIVI